MGVVRSYVRSIPAAPESLEDTAVPFPYGRLVVGTRHCRVLISGNINSDAIGIDINQPFMGGLEAHPTRKFSLCGTGILPVLENIVKLDKN